MKTASIGNNIAEFRKSRGKTAEQLAEALRVSRQTISKWENGETIPNAYNVLDMATYLDVNVSDIYRQILINRAKNDVENKDKDSIRDRFINTFSSGIDEKKTIQDAIVAFERSFIPFKIKTGFSVIRYEEILRRFNSGYVMGIKENDHPVLAQRLKSVEFIMPALCEYLKENLFLVLHDKYTTDEGSNLAIIIRNEHELLKLKECIKLFYLGLVKFKDHKYLREQFAATQNFVSSNEDEKKRYCVWLFDSSILEYATDLDECRILLIDSVDTEEEANSVIQSITSLDNHTLKELLEYNIADSIYIEDSKQGTIAFRELNEKAKNNFSKFEKRIKEYEGSQNGMQ